MNKILKFDKHRIIYNKIVILNRFRYENPGPVIGSLAAALEGTAQGQHQVQYKIQNIEVHASYFFYTS